MKGNTMDVLKAMRLATRAYPEVPTAELQEAQGILGEDIWDCSEAEKNARRAAYDAIVSTLEERDPLLGAAITDPWSFDTYSDVYKDDHGFRPRGPISGAGARQYLRARRVNDYFDKLKDHAEDMAGDHYG